MLSGCFQVNIFMITGHFSPAKRPVWSSNQFRFFFFFFADCFRVNIFLTTGHFFHFVYLELIDQSSSSQIHQKFNLSQDSPNRWNEARFTKNVKWAKLWDFNFFKASLSRWIGVGNEGKFDTLYTFGTGVDIGNPESPGYSWQSARLTSGRFRFRKCQF